METNIHIAASSSEDVGAPPQLLAGDTPAVSTPDMAITVSGSAIPQYSPLQKDPTTGALEPWVHDGGEPIAAITAFEMPVGTSRKAMYVAGCFNLDAITWPAGTTEAEVQAAQTGSLVFRKLLYSDKRTGNEGDPGEPAGPA